jgi:hypothetical protein
MGIPLNMDFLDNPGKSRKSRKIMKIFQNIPQETILLKAPQKTQKRTIINPTNETINR